MSRLEGFLSGFKEVPPEPAPFAEPDPWTMRAGYQKDGQGTLFSKASDKTVDARRGREYARVNRGYSERNAVLSAVPTASLVEYGTTPTSELRRPEPENVKMTETKSGQPMQTVVYPENGRIAAFSGGRQIGAIDLKKERDKRFVSVIGVAEDARRQGVATAMWEHGQEHFGELRHDVPRNRTTEGHKWSKAVGGKDWKNHKADSPRPRDAY